jgi:hypothetical protein
MSVDLPFETESDADAYRVLQVVDRCQTFARDFRFGVREPLLPVPIVVLETCRSPVADLDLTVAYRRGRRV